MTTSYNALRSFHQKPYAFHTEILWQQLLDIILVILYLLGVSPEKLSKFYSLTDCHVMNRRRDSTPEKLRSKRTKIDLVPASGPVDKDRCSRGLS